MPSGTLAAFHTRSVERLSLTPELFGETAGLAVLVGLIVLLPVFAEAMMPLSLDPVGVEIAALPLRAAL